MQGLLRGSGRAVWLWTGGLLVLAGCASTPPGSRPLRSPDGAVLATPGRDGAEANPPAGLDRVPDAEPRLEPIRTGGPNKPYEVFGRDYVPMTNDRPYRERGLASWYGRKFHGQRTSSGEPYDMYAMTAAHPTLPIPSYARVRNPANGREVVVRVNDRGPFHAGRIIDLSYTAALRLDLLRGVAPVEVERITYDEIRTGSWRRQATPTSDGTAAVAVAGARIEAPTLAANEAPGVASSAGAELPSSPSTVVATVDRPVTGERVAADALEFIAARDAAPTRAEPTAAAVGGEARSGEVAPGFWVQLGAFRERSGAAAFQRRVGDALAWLSPRLAVHDDASLFRLQAGPYASRADARDAADSIRSALQLVPVIVERR